MSDSARAQRFADALQKFESSGDSADLLDQFAEDAELTRPEADRSDSETDAAAFWDAYLAQFDSIQTSFAAVEEAGDRGILEWLSTGSLSTGRDVDYRGVSLLTFDDDDKVSRFATYYDTAAFLEPSA
jgi:ketosteroid isomerase-like protein